MCISRATVSAVSCLVVPAFICIDLLISRVLKINDDDDDENCFINVLLKVRFKENIEIQQEPRFRVYSMTTLNTHRRRP